MESAQPAGEESEPPEEESEPLEVSVEAEGSGPPEEPAEAEESALPEEIAEAEVARHRAPGVVFMNVNTPEELARAQKLVTELG